MISQDILFLLWFALIICEVYRNWYVIEHLKKVVDHNQYTLLRVLVGSSFWMLSIFLVMNDLITLGQWIFMPVMMAFTFWFYFDLLLNVVRKKSIFYYGEGSKLDRMQSEFALPWTFFKCLAAHAAILAWYKLF